MTGMSCRPCMQIRRRKKKVQGEKNIFSEDKEKREIYVELVRDDSAM